MTDLSSKIITVKELLQTGNLKIPNYQRPYKWTEKNVNQLLDDILLHKDKSAYRLGTLVVHHENGALNIVDGQQRSVTLLLIIHALINHKKLEQIGGFLNFSAKLVNFSFSNEISKANIQNNYKVIERRINDFDQVDTLFLLNNCELVEVALTNISEAFQFFDSQNARGKDLEPHDLLKAFHLREMQNSSTEQERLQSVKNWENMDAENLSKLFALYLYRIRNWSKGYSAKYFTKNDVDVFKGVSPQIEEDYPFTKIFRIAHFYTENYNQSYHRDIDKNRSDYPFQIDQTIINGKRFFEMIAYYDKLIHNVKNIRENVIINTLRTYPGNYRTGDKYVRNLFHCGLIYYIDKFGDRDLQKVIDKIFIWAYTLRLKLYSVRMESVDNYALNRAHSQIQLFTKIREAIHPNDILNMKLTVLQPKELQREIKEIVELFREKRYYE